MNQQKFEQILGQLAPRRKEVLQRVLKSESDAVIAASMGIGEPTVRKHIERVCEEFGLENNSQEGRRYKRSDLVVLFAKYKPELLSQSTLAPTTQPPEAQTAQIKNQYDGSDSAAKLLIDQTQEILLQLIPVAQPHQEELLEQMKLHSSELQKQDIANLLNKIGHKFYMNSNFSIAKFYLEWAVKFNIDFGQAHYNLGSTYEKLNEIPQACYHYKIATQFKNRAAYAAINNLARLEILEGNSAKAVEIIEPILLEVQDNMVKASLHKNNGWAYFEQKLYAKAKQHLFISIELEIDYLPALFLLAKVHEAERDYKSAKNYWKKSLECDTHEQQIKRFIRDLPELHMWQVEAHRSFITLRTQN